MFQFIKKKKYQQAILDSFPSYLEQDVKSVFSILDFDNAFNSSHSGSYKVDNLIHPDTSNHLIQDEEITIPTRIYFNEPADSEISKLTETQLQILNCIFLRSANGYVRERNLRQLNGNYTPWIAPYIILTIGDYVIQNLLQLESQLNQENIKTLKKYISQNPKIWKLQKARMTSYWNCYYREEFEDMEEYVGRRIVGRVGYVRKCHFKSIYKTGELDELSTVANYATVQLDG
jgi:hypothetical protein